MGNVMGNINNCCVNEKIKMDDNKKIFQINRIKENKDKSTNSSDKMEDNLNNGEYQLLSYDIEENSLFKYTVKIPIINSLKGISELNFNSKLYLCGTSSVNEDNSSYLFQITFNNLNTQIMVSSLYGHYYPSLISINRCKIICIGGKNQTLCELYDIDTHHWTNIPELPEERYKCTLCFDYKNKFIYLFGGINNRKNSINENYIEKDSILRLNTKNYISNSWEKILIESRIENKLLTRISSAALFLNENNIIIIGGENENGKILKNIIKYNISEYSVSLTGKNLDFPSKFTNQSTIVDKNEERNFYYFFDSKNNIHNINKLHYLSTSNNDELKINMKS